MRPKRQSLPDTERRMAALAEMGMTTPDSDGIFDPIARLARRAAGSDQAFVSLVSDQDVWLKGASGSDLRKIEHECFCDYAIQTSDPLVVSELGRDARFDGRGIALHMTGATAYAGVPVRLSNGLIIGAVCALNLSPRTWEQDAIESLRDLAEVVAGQCERRLELQRLNVALAEQARADAAMNSFIQHAPVALSMLDKELRFVQVSPRWRMELGVGDADVIGKHVDEVFPASVATWTGGFLRCLAGETVKAESTRYLDTKGEEVWLRAEMTPWRGPDGEVAGILAMTHNITDMIASMRETERSEQRLTMAVEIADLLVFDCDIQSGQSYHLGALRLVGDNPPTQIRSIRDILGTIHPDDQDRVLKDWLANAARGAVRDSIDYRVNRAGETVWVSSTAQHFLDDSGQPTRLLGILQDVTSRYASAEAMAEARARAEAASQAKTQFLANMSHEIRTLLNGVVGVAGALAATPLTPRQKSMVALIESSATALERLLSDVLDLARVESGRMVLHDEAFDLMEMLQGVCALFAPRAEAQGVAFRFDACAEAACEFIGDAPRIRQILNNLLSNAVKFTSQGRISLSVRRAQGGPPDATRIRLEVADTGIGFRAEDKERLFQRFEQADGSVTRQYGGTGLGLAISRALAEDMGGRLDAEPGAAGGSVFSLELNLRPADPREQEAVGPVAAAEFHRTDRPLKILLAEDHAANRHVVSLILDAIQADLTVACNGAEAVQVSAHSHFDLILMDIQMPVMDGLTATRIIRQRERAEGRVATPILVLSANAMPEQLAESVSAGADGHITKPVRASNLIAQVLAACAPDADRATPERHRG